MRQRFYPKHNESQISLSPVTREPQGKSTTGYDPFSGHRDNLTFYIYLLGIKSPSSFVTSTGCSVSILSQFSTCFSRSIHKEKELYVVSPLPHLETNRRCLSSKQKAQFPWSPSSPVGLWPSLLWKLLGGPDGSE